MYNPLSKELISLMNKHLILPWVYKHKCKQDFCATHNESDKSEKLSNDQKACVTCEEQLLWYQLAKDLLIFISPKQEIDLPETHFHYLIEMNSSQNKFNVQHGAYNYHHHASSFEPISIQQHKMNEAKKPAADNATLTDNTQDENTQLTENNPELGVWVTSQGTYYFKLTSLHAKLQFFYSILKHLNQIFDIDALNYALMCLKMLMLHGACLETAAKDQKGFLIYCLEKYLIPR